MTPEKPELSSANEVNRQSRPPVWTQGWVWTAVVCPLAYWIAVSIYGPTGRDVFLFASIGVAAVGLLGILVWKLGPKNEILFQVSSFLLNWVFIAYFISLLTRT